MHHIDCYLSYLQGQYFSVRAYVYARYSGLYGIVSYACVYAKNKSPGDVAGACIIANQFIKLIYSITCPSRQTITHGFIPGICFDMYLKAEHDYKFFDSAKV